MTTLSRLPAELQSQDVSPTRVRYTAMSLPYHVGTGWIGGFLPVTSFALATITGDIYAALWYPIVFTIIPIIVSLIFLKETRGKPLEEVFRRLS